MPRRKAAPRLYLDPARKQWVIRDGAHFVRTGCAQSDTIEAEKSLREYLGKKHTPKASASPVIADVLNVYAAEHLPHTKAVQNAIYNIANLKSWWGALYITDITARNCRSYAGERDASAARRDLETLRAAVNYWHREYGPLTSVPAIVLPPKPEPRDRWLTRKEAARLLWAARRTPHLAKFILLGIYTGSRSGVILNLEWSWLDLERGTMRRRATGVTETKKRAPPVRLGRKILTHLRRWKRLYGRQSKYVVHFDGQPIKKLKRSWAAACKRAKIKEATPHTLRHTRATWLMQGGIDPWEAAGHLGMSVETLQRVYGKHSPDFQKRAAEV